MEASSRVQAMFHDINSALFDHTKTGSKVLDHECDEWSNKYPHIRCVRACVEHVHAYVCACPILFHHGILVE